MTADLFPFQRKLIDAMSDRDALFVAADMGLGKTRCAIEASKRVSAERVLVIAPTIGLVSWPAELAKWNPDANVLPVTDPDLLGGRVPDRQTFAIVPFSEVARQPRLWVQAAQRFSAQANVIDEAHYLKEAMAARTQAVYGYRTDLRDAMLSCGARHNWPMSGTPAPNFTAELWTHLHALAPELIKSPRHGRPMGEQEFRERFSTVRTSTYGQHVTGSVNTPRLRAMTASFFYRIRKSEVRSDMPPILWTHEPLPISAATAAQHLEIPDAVDDAGLLDWLRDAYPSGSSERKAVGLAKVAGGVEWARNFLANSDRKLIMFAWHREVVGALHAALGPEFGSVMIDGDTSVAQRTAAVTSFQMQGAGPRLFVGQMLAAGTAITLTEASDVAFLEDDWTPGTMEQAAARADRLGQTRGVVARILYTPGTKDERIARVRTDKARDFNLMFN